MVAAHPKLRQRSKSADLSRDRDQAVLAHVQNGELRHGQYARRKLGERVVAQLPPASKETEETPKQPTCTSATRVSSATLSDTATSC